MLTFIKEKDTRIKEIEALRQHIFDYSKTRKIYLEYKRLPKAKKTEFIRAKQNADVILCRQQEERDEKMQEKL